MAKIYETQEDVERARLSRKADRERGSEEVLRNSGISSLLMGWLSYDLGAVKEELHAVKRSSGSGSAFDKVLSGILVGTGIVSLGLSFMKRKSAKEAEVALEKLGPEEIVFPPEMEAKTEDCKPCRLKSKSLLQYADHSESAPAKAR